MDVDRAKSLRSLDGAIWLSRLDLEFDVNRADLRPPEVRPYVLKYGVRNVVYIIQHQRDKVASSC